MCVDNRAGTSGFTLLEVIVAVVIATVALLGMFEAASGGLMAAETAGRVEEAVERAQSHLAALGRGEALVQGDLSGDDGAGFHWDIEVRPVAARPALGLRQPPGPSLYTVAVTISWHEGRRRKAVVLNTLRLGAPG